MILSICQSIEMQITAYKQFRKVYDEEEARKQTQICMNAILQQRNGGKNNE